MMTAPLYMTEKVGMMTWSRSQPAAPLHRATRTRARQPAATLPVRPRGRQPLNPNESVLAARAYPSLPTFSRAFF